ncbi:MULTISPECIES: NACHT domain-containing NTPase [Microbacterium]|uniref:NACHT domain-containing protein n=1 Tax=Microbacterium TaxID=33882 RepID=UPI0011EB9B1C|nr:MULTISPECIES: hypothetical protein [Microbacterium]
MTRKDFVGHYNLNRMGWQQFEHMLQALAKAELGNGVRPFGSGRDAQRDATFDGRVDFPVGAGAKWDGYGVIQMKYNEKPVSTTADWRWFLDEVRSELRGWLVKKRVGEKTPEYLLFSTNVVLTGTKDTGGRDQFDQLLAANAEDLGLRGWYVWDYDEIRVMLDTHTSIRQRYLEQIVTGDFLAQVAELLPEKTALEADRLAGHAVAELINRQWVRTGDAGYNDASKVTLADIAIDLPFTAGVTADAEGQSRRMTAAETVRIGDLHLSTTAGRGPHGVVIVGGPGQGKSTIAQVIAHTYRVAFLADTNVEEYGERAKRAFDGLDTRLRKAGIPNPQKRRWPFVIELAKAGAVIASSPSTFSLLTYIADSILIRGKKSDPSALLDWLRTWPSCLVLDGLDEVPDAKIRSRLIEAVTALVSELSSEKADVLFVATTRPQGYRREFDDAFPCTQITLSELTETEAISYSEALTALRAANDPDLAEQVAQRLITAVHERVTQRLMTTPLQVTIMTALAEEAVDLPTDRFELFDRYYRVVYDRELAKSEAFTELKSLRPHIDHLHEQAGLKLQARTERPGNSDAVLTKSEISRILRHRLSSAGFEESESESIATTLLKLSTERLVMLVSPKTSKYEFEVRSLQEYMAARAITDGDEQVVLQNLRELVPSSHWRNTWLLAAGRLLKRREHLIDDVIDIVVRYDIQSAESPITALGASLAGDLYLDNFGIEFPATRRKLLSAAVNQFADLADGMPAGVANLLATALEQSEREHAIVLDALHELSRENPSNLATRALSDNRTGMSDLAKQARTTLTEGRKYIRPEPGPIHADAAILARALARASNPGAEVLLLVEQLQTPGAVWRGRSLGVSVDMLIALERDAARPALAAAAKSLSQSSPASAALSIELLRLHAASKLRGDTFAK